MMLPIAIILAVLALALVVAISLRGADDTAALQPGSTKDLAPSGVLQRLFSQEDWSYIRSNCTPAVRRLFVRERTRLALLWLGESRQAASYFWNKHRSIARGSPALAPRSELRLAANFGLFWCANMLMTLLVIANRLFTARRLWASVRFPAQAVARMSDGLRMDLLAGASPEAA
jgi:hypothetical protein